MSRILTYEEISQKYIDNGCELLVKKEDYINTQHTMLYKCKCENISTTSYNNYRKHLKCKKCNRINYDYNYDNIFNIINQTGYKLLTLSEEYKGLNSNIKVECLENHIYTVRCSSFINQNNRCKKCASVKLNKDRKNDYEFVKSKINIDGYTLISTDYKNNKEKLNIRCPVGHIFQMRFGNFHTLSQRCSECFGTKINTIEDVKYYTKKIVGYELISTYYINAHKYLDFKCNEGHFFSMKFNNFKNLGQRCRECYLNEKVRGENNPNYNKDRTRRSRINYLQFDHNKLYILKNEPLYEIYLQSQQDAKISNNYWDRTNYRVDHIFPKKAFIDNNLDNIHSPLIIKKIANIRENLRIISHEDNGSKGGKYNQEEFMKWFNNKINTYT